MMEYEDNGAIRTKRMSSTNELLSQTFFVMFLGLLATAIASIYTYASGMYIEMLTGNTYMVLCIAELVVAFVFSLFFRKLSSGVVTLLFFAYSILTGVTFSVLFAVFDITSIAYAFIATAGIFGALAYIGKTTNKDLSSLGTLLSVTLFAGIILTIVNLFIGSTTLDIILNWGILFIFMGFTLYDMNKLTHLSEMGYITDDKLHIYGAMELYLDFINIFIRILQIFARNRD